MRVLYRKLCRHPKKWAIRHLFQVFFLGILSIVVLVAVLAYITSSNFVSPISQSSHLLQNHLQLLSHHTNKSTSLHQDSTNRKNQVTNNYSHYYKLIPLSSAPVRHVASKSKEGRRRNQHDDEEHAISIEMKGGWTKCSMYNCFDIHRCGMNGRQQLSIYIYPIERIIIDGVPLFGDDSHSMKISAEFYEFLDAIRKSPFYVPNPNDACIFVPSIDTLMLPKALSNNKSIAKLNSTNQLEDALSSLKFWGRNGQNHLLLWMYPKNSPLLAMKSEAIIASSGFPVESYRPGFHVPVISYNPLVKAHKFNNKTSSNSNSYYFRNKRIIAISTQGQLPISIEDDINVLVLDFCNHRPTNYLERCKGRHVFSYPEVLDNVDFCLVVKDLTGPALWDVMSVGCIPVIIADFQRLPFDDIIDWRRNAIILLEQQIPDLSSILKSVSQKRRLRLKSQVNFTFNTYFKNMYQITSTLLSVLHDRVFSHNARTLWDWNYNPQLDKPQQPLFNPVIAPKDAGFTAVILAYERVPSLFQVIERISMVPSLSKIIVVWNNQVMAPPQYSSWPKVSKPMKVIKMEKNKMSNRFYPFDDIETEAVFSLDDDIVMLTVDEIEFGFQTWREFPDRIVGFPSRSHVWDNSSQRWKYESEWTNEISMVLTGAAFYHKYWHEAYTHEMPSEIRNMVDAKMNCEDIAMNFLVSSRTGRPPIKVTPRKKFKCPTCSNNEMLSSDSSHMIERTDCMNKFTQIYGFMPLIVAEFRADPVLYKVDNLSKKLKKFNDIGSL